MENQQFENQEWQTPQQHYGNTDPREQQGPQGQQGYYPQPVYVDPREKIQPPPRRHRPWLWIVAAIVIIALLGSGIQSGLRNVVNTSSETHTYSVSTLPTLVLNDDTGTVTIHTGGSGSQVTIQATKHFQSFGSAPAVQYSQSGDTINATVKNQNDSFMSFGSDNVDFNVTIPANANLDVHSDTGTINVTGVSGTMALTTDTGSITANEDTLSGPSTLKSDTGSVTFAGSIGTSGSYQFLTDTGSVNATLPANASFHVDASTDTGSINSDFTEVNVQKQDFAGGSAHGDVGSNPNATVTLKTNTGSINLHKG
jgi:hypothetical protein